MPQTLAHQKELGLIKGQVGEGEFVERIKTAQGAMTMGAGPDIIATVALLVGLVQEVVAVGSGGPRIKLGALKPGGKVVIVV